MLLKPLRVMLLGLVLATPCAARPVERPVPLPTPASSAVVDAPVVRMYFVRGYTRKDGRYVQPHWRAVKVRHP
jgi:hypothetical protein